MCDKTEFKIPSIIENRLVKRVKLPEEIDANSEFKNKEIYIQLWNDDDIIKEKEMMIKYPHLFHDI
jgi:hypothetical protein